MANWHKRMMDTAKLVASWSKDPSRQVGAVIFNPITHAVLSQGYNGFARGVTDDIQTTCDRETRLRHTVHAETNAIYSAARHGIRLVGMAMAGTLYPCASCALAIVQSGIDLVVTYQPDWENDKYSADFAVTSQIFSETNTQVVFLMPELHA